VTRPDETPAPPEPGGAAGPGGDGPRPSRWQAARPSAARFAAVRAGVARVAGRLTSRGRALPGKARRLAGRLRPGRPPGGESARPDGTWPLSRILGVAVGVTALVAVLSVVVGSLAIAGLSDARDRLTNKLDPATFQALRLDTALVNQETGVRGYALSGQLNFLKPYYDGKTAENQATASLRTLLSGEPDAEAVLAQVARQAGAWRANYADPTIRRIQRKQKPLSGGVGQGKAVFDSVRHSVGVLQHHIAVARQGGQVDLHRASTTLVAVCITIAVVLVLIVVVLALGLRTAAIQPLSRLAVEASRVADGDFQHEVEQSGPREIREVGADVNRMRGRILRELSRLREANADLETRTRDLQRSNSELEQFAYVASHDLQEPLRKVASFCQLLQRRYAAQLDERANQYIDLAVDGAKRMQALITDLLTFSRVGRGGAPFAPVPLAAALGYAMASLSEEIESTGARVEVGALPEVLGEESLLTAVFQNLLSNAVKFHGPQPPHIAVSARKVGVDWLVTVADNGIGVPAEFADRIFVIFQRLHARDKYPGTGIGLAMCRKIIEYHGGRIWLDTPAEAGSRFCFTLPVMLKVGAADD
jgi:signal transduction histidine kinase